MKKLELKHLAPYLPYGLKVKNGKDILTMDIEDDGFASISRIIFHQRTGHYKIILRPLSDLTKYEVEEDVTGDITLYDYIEKLWFITIREDGHFSHKNGDGTCTGYTYKSCDYSLIQLLFEHHFDVFGLIPQGLAIDINTLK